MGLYGGYLGAVLWGWDVGRPFWGYLWGSILGLKGPGLNLATWGLRYGAQWRPLGTCPL